MLRLDSLLTDTESQQELQAHTLLHVCFSFSFRLVHARHAFGSVDFGLRPRFFPDLARRGAAGSNSAAGSTGMSAGSFLKTQPEWCQHATIWEWLRRWITKPPA